MYVNWVYSGNNYQDRFPVIQSKNNPIATVPVTLAKTIRPHLNLHQIKSSAISYKSFFSITSSYR